jgi:hypothetical protein
MGTSNTRRRCAYRRLVPARLFNSKLWPLINYAVCLYCNNCFRTSSFDFFNETLWELSIPRGDVHIAALTLNNVMALD